MSIDTCSRCKREGLALYIALYSAAPMAAAKYASVPTGNFGAGITDIALQANQYYLRSVEPGYIYLLYPGKVWRGYAVTPNGGLLYYANLANEDLPSSVPKEGVPTKCDRGGHNNYSVQTICIENPQLVKGTIWIAYSRHRWSKATRNALAKNPGTRMQAIEKLDGSAFPHAIVASAQGLLQSIANFRQGAVKALNEALPEDEALIYRSESEAKELEKTMLATSASMKKSGLIMALWDPIGITASLNRTRNAALAEQSLFEVQYARENFNTHAIRTIEKATKGNKEFKERWDDKYSDAISWGRVTAHEKKMRTERDKVKTKIALAAQDWTNWYTGNNLHSVMGHDFDPNTVTDGTAYLSATLWMSFGAGGNEYEQKNWLPRAIDTADVRNYLWRALTLNQTTLSNQLSKMDSVALEWDALKNIYGGIDSWLQQLDHAKALDRGHTTLSPYSKEPLVDIVSKLFVQLQTLYGHAVSRGASFTRAALFAAYLHGVEMRPISSPQSVKRIVGMQREVIWQPTAALFEQTHITRTSAHWETHWRASLNTLTQAADIQVYTELTLTQFAVTRVRTATVWQPVENFKQFEIELANVRAVSSTSPTSKKPIKPTQLQISNWWKQNKALIGAKILSPQVAGTVSAVALTFQGISFSKAMDDLAKAPKDKNSKARTYALMSMSSASIASIGLSMEVISASWLATRKSAAQIAGKVAFDVLKRRTGMLSGIGGMVGGVAGAVSATQAWMQANDLAQAGDSDAAIWSRGQSALIAFSGAVGIGAGASAISLATGGTGAISVGLGSIGPAGWAILAVGAIVLLIGAAFMTEGARDDPMEQWLKKSLFGTNTAKQDKWKNGPQEAKAFEALFDPQWQTELAWFDRQPMFGNNGKDYADELLKVDIKIPQMSPNSLLAVDIHLYDRQQRKYSLNAIVNAAGLKKSGDPDAAPPYLSQISGRVRDGHLNFFYEYRQQTYKGELISGGIPNTRPLFVRADVVLRFWPDRVEQSFVVLPNEYGRAERLPRPRA